MSTPASPLPRKPRQPRKKLGTPKTDMYVTPGWQEDEEPYTTPEGEQYPNLDTDAKKKARKLQRT